MIVDEHDCQLSQDECQSYKTSSQNERNWCLMFPETMQFDSTTTIEDDIGQTQMHDLHNNKNNPVISIDAIDVITQLMPNDERKIRPRHNKSDSSSSSSSSESSSSFEDLIFTGDKLLKQTSTGTNNHVLEQSCGNTEVENINTSSFLRPEEIVENFETKTLSSPLHSPPVQEMLRDEGYDVQRIPATVFARSNSIAPAEWSIASNDSLFSLHIGNASIDKEQSILITEELKKHGDLPTSSDTSTEDDAEVCKPAEEDLIEDADEISSLSQFSKSDDVFKTTPINDVEKKKEIRRDSIKEEIITEMLTRKDEKVKQHRPSVHSSSVSLRSNTSEDSNFSFAFPLLDEGEKNMTTRGQSSQPLVAQQQQQKVSKNTSCCWCCPCFSCLSCCNPCASCSSFFSCFSCFSCKSCHSNCSLWSFCSCCKFCSCCSTKSTLVKCC
ncbi:hypothetical protein RND81_02G211400 [Saponaria officinalis]|uniref:Uncharacterized protein n=1 Tax=Saponaria officinalis TaxID=3572 RepID=A0AAW1MW77_SAPOF